jgi:hypothetical protein
MDTISSLQFSLTTMPCFFCGQSATLTREHVIPRWMKKSLDGHSGWERGYWFRSAVPMERTKALRRHRTDMVVRRVCTRCNSGWMSDLEVAARRLLEPLIAGETIKVEAYERQLLLRWALKTAAVFGVATRAEDAVSPELRRKISEGSDLGLSVSLFAVPLAHDEVGRANDWRFSLDVYDTPRSPFFTITGFSFGKIAFEVANLNGTDTSALERFPNLTPVLYQRIAPPALGPTLIPSPTTASSIKEASGVSFNDRFFQLMAFAAQAGVDGALPRRR